jgi:hypothetical protein
VGKEAHALKNKPGGVTPFTKWSKASGEFMAVKKPAKGKKKFKGVRMEKGTKKAKKKKTAKGSPRA